MAHRTFVGAGYDIKGGRTLVGGTGYDIKSGRTLVNGTGYDISFGKAITELAVGTNVYMNVNGSRKEWTVIHNGCPTIYYYDSTANGIWLMLNHPYQTYSFNNSDFNDYSMASVNTYLNNTFYNYLDSGIRNMLLQVNVPYCYYDSSLSYNNKFVKKVYNDGAKLKVFLLALTEVGGTASSITSYNIGIDGSKLDYFSYNDSTTRIAYNENGVAVQYWTRSPGSQTTSMAATVETNGGFGSASCTNSLYLRPVVIVPKTTMVDSNFNILAA